MTKQDVSASEICGEENRSQRILSGIASLAIAGILPGDIAVKAADKVRTSEPVRDASKTH